MYNFTCTGAPSTPSPTNNLTLPSPTSKDLRSVSRASTGSGESDVEVLHARLSEKDRQIEEQQKMLEEHARSMEQQKRQMYEQQRQMDQIMEMMKNKMSMSK